MAVDAGPLAELLGQVPPGGTGSGVPENPIQNNAVVSWFAPVSGADSEDEVFKERPLIVRHQITCQAGLHSRNQLESCLRRGVNLFCQHDLEIVARAPSIEQDRISRILVSGYRAALTLFDFREAWVWLDGLMNANSNTARSVLISTFDDLQSARQRELFLEYLGREGNKPSLEEGSDPVRSEHMQDAILLEWLVQASYLAWPPEKDVKHERVCSPGKADQAESNRRNYTNMLAAFQTPGVVSAFGRLAKSKTLASYRDTFLYQIELMKRGAGRRPEFSPDEAIRFLNDQSKAPATMDEFRKLCQSHLTTLLERLHTSDDDESAFFRRGEAKEGDLRNWLAARLRDAGERYYTVIREQKVAGEKRLDIRLHSRVDALGTVSVEIKLADMTHWTGDQLTCSPEKSSF